MWTLDRFICDEYVKNERSVAELIRELRREHGIRLDYCNFYATLVANGVRFRDKETKAKIFKKERGGSIYA